MQENPKPLKESLEPLSSELILKLFKYFFQFRKQSQFKIFPLAKITVLSWLHDKKLASKIDKLAAFLEKHRVKPDQYVKWLVLVKKAPLNPSCLVSPENLKEYFLSYVKEQAGLKRIYDSYLSSCMYIASLCMSSGIHSASVIIKHLIDSNSVAALVISGKISPYFLASFSNIRELCRNMDSLNKGTLAQTLKFSDVLNEQVQRACLSFRHCQADTVCIIDSIVRDKYNNFEKTSEQQR